MEAYSKKRRLVGTKPNTPVPPPIDSDITEMFSMLEIQATFWGGDRRSSALHLERMRDCEIAVGEIPKEFKDIRDAWRMVFPILLRAIHLRLAQSNAGTPLSSDAKLSHAPMITLAPVAGDAQHAELRSVLSQFRQWASAFEPFLRRTKNPLVSTDVLKNVMTLYIYYLAAFMWAASGSANRADYYRCYTKELCELVRVCKMMSDVNDEYFSLDIRIVMPLQVVAMNFRHRALRKEIIGIYSQLPRREGMWDAAMVIKVLSWITEIEEVGLVDEEYVPEDCVATVTGLKVDAENRTAVIQCLQGVRGCPGQTIPKENTVYW
ncbi:MAG: hypothetical protein CL912_01630 [Deltaproteobacteria bacterium]|nr:hypothetical protein [Deltaproteobacteria bacterium]